VKVTLGRTTLRLEGRVVVAQFDDGTSCTATPHGPLDCGVSHPVGEACGFDAYQALADREADGNVLTRAWQHELAHVVVGLTSAVWAKHTTRCARQTPPGVSVVLWSLAHGLPTDTPACLAEEREAVALQLSWHRRAT